MSVKNWVLASRPKTLTASVVPIFVASAVVKNLGFPLHISLSLWALVSVICLQIATNLVNDAKDFEKGTDNQDRIGPLRVTATGLLTSRQVMGGAMLFFLGAFAAGIPLIQAGGWPLVFIGLASILCGYIYTGGPYPLAYLGLGDFFVLLFFGWVAVLGLFFVQTQKLSWEAFVAGTQVGLLATVLIAINNLRDWRGDAKNHKKTLPVRFGETFGKKEISALLFFPFLLGLYWRENSPLAFYLPFLTLPLAYYIDRKIQTTSPSPLYNKFLALAALLQLLFGGLLGLGLMHGK